MKEEISEVSEISDADADKYGCSDEEQEVFLYQSR